MEQKIRSVLQSVVVIICFALIACAAVADDVLVKRGNEEYSGSCGKHVFWSYNATAHVLTIEGNGNMNEYDDDESVPWNQVRAFITNVIVKENVTSIGSYSFYSCVSLKSISIPFSVTSIGSHCFERCFDLVTIDIPSNVTSIKESTFNSCKSLMNMVIPTSVTSIGDNAFQLCSSLTSITIPLSVTSIGTRTFQQCTSLTNLTLPSSITSIGAHAFQLCTSLNSIEFPPNVTTVEKTTFSRCYNLTSVVFPSNLKKIGSQAFKDCSSLDNVTFPSSVDTIDDSAFSGCLSLSNVRLSSKGLITFGKWVFSRCNLTNITIPSTVTSIGARMFSFCHNLINIDVEADNTVYMSVDGVLFKRDKMVLVHYPCGREGDYIMPDNVTSITAYSFEGSKKLTSVTIPSSVTSIGYSPFLACTSLVSINVSTSNGKFKSIDGVLFTHNGTNLIQYPCGMNESYIMPDDVYVLKIYSFGGCVGLKSVTISSNVTTIENHVFQGCTSLTSITIPSSVTSVGICPFSGCSNLVSITVDDNNPSFVDINGVLFNHNKTKLIQYPCGHSSSYTVPDNVTAIGIYSFYNCSGITSVTIPSTVTTIEEAAFNMVEIAYVNYLGSNEPDCSDVATTFVVVDLICVPLNYSHDSFCGRYTVKVSSCEEFVAQQNQCYEVLEWQAEEIIVKKRANATLWEKKTNNCFEYQCSNTSGGVAWSKCNSTGDVHQMCIDNQCVEEETINKDKYGVELNVNISANDFDIEELTYILSNATGIVNLTIGTESTSTTGNVIRIVVFVDDEDVANVIVNTIENKGEGEECTIGVLCDVNEMQILHKEDEESDGENMKDDFLVLSSANNIDFSMMSLSTVVFVMMMMMM